jgi:hypothetical protein
LRVTTTVGFGQGWLTEKVQEFQGLYPDVQVQLLLDNEELDVNMRQADCAIRLRQPQQPDLIQRRLFTVHLHIYASPTYLARHGEPKTIEDFDNHRIITFGEPAPGYLTDVNWLEQAGDAGKPPPLPNCRSTICRPSGAPPQWRRHFAAARLHDQPRPCAGAAQPTGRHPDLRHLFLLCRGNEKRGQTQSLPGFPDLQGAQLEFLIRPARALEFLAKNCSTEQDLRISDSAPIEQASSHAQYSHG